MRTRMFRLRNSWMSLALKGVSRPPLFQVWFVMQNTPPVEVDLPELRVEKLPIEDSFTKFDLMLSLGEGQEKS